MGFASGLSNGGSQLCQGALQSCQANGTRSAAPPQAVVPRHLENRPLRRRSRALFRLRLCMPMERQQFRRACQAESRSIIEAHNAKVAKMPFRGRFTWCRAVIPLAGSARGSFLKFFVFSNGLTKIRDWLQRSLFKAVGKAIPASRSCRDRAAQAWVVTVQCE